MSGSTRGLLAFVAILSLIAAARGEAADVPYLTGRVVDNAEILSAEARARVTAALKQHEDVTSNQIVVLTVPSIGSESIEAYAVNVFASWKLGQKGKDNGVLIVIVPQGVWHHFDAPDGVTLLTATPQPTEHLEIDVADPRTVG